MNRFCVCGAEMYTVGERASVYTRKMKEWEARHWRIGLDGEVEERPGHGRCSAAECYGMRIGAYARKQPVK